MYVCMCKRMTICACASARVYMRIHMSVYI